MVASGRWLFVQWLATVEQSMDARRQSKLLWVSEPEFVYFQTSGLGKGRNINAVMWWILLRPSASLLRSSKGATTRKRDSSRALDDIHMSFSVDINVVMPLAICFAFLEIIPDNTHQRIPANRIKP